MRKFFLIGLLFIFLSCSPKISTNPIEKDCEYLRTVLTEASIDFNQAVDAGLDIDDFINDVKNRYIKFAEKDCKTKYEKPDENGIYNTAFAVAITYALQNSLKRENTHMTIKGKNEYIAKSYVNRVYLSDIFFEKIDDAFYVQNKFNSDIAKVLVPGDFDHSVTGEKSQKVTREKDQKSHLTPLIIRFPEDCQKQFLPFL